jgi:hypothetical protein
LKVLGDTHEGIVAVLSEAKRYDSGINVYAAVIPI